MSRPHVLGLLLSGAAGLVPAPPATAQTTYYLHGESSTVTVGAFDLKTSLPDSEVLVRSSGNLRRRPPQQSVFGWWDTSEGVPGLSGIIPAGSTVTATLWMRKTTSFGTVLPYASMKVNDYLGDFFCSAYGTVPLTTTLTPYSISCQTTAPISMVATDRLIVFPGYSMTEGSGNKSMAVELHLEGSSPSHFLMPDPGPAPMMSASWSNCPAASPTDWEDDTAALQACLDVGGTLVLDPGFPGYIVNGLNGDSERGLWLSIPGTVLTSSQAPARATIAAGRDLFTYILRTPPGSDVNDFRIEHIAFNGMVDTFLETSPYRLRRDDCADGAGAGNLWLQGYGPFYFVKSESTHALCGTGLAVWGDFRIDGNLIASNGRDAFSGGLGQKWADGLSVHHCENGRITNNVFADNTRVDLLLGGGRSCTASGNLIVHSGKQGLVGLNVGALPGPSAGDHSGSVYSGNVIQSGAAAGQSSDRLGVGLLVGALPGSSGLLLVEAGSVAGNDVR